MIPQSEAGGVITVMESVRNVTVAVGTSSVIISENRNRYNPRKVITIRNNSPNAADIITVNMGFSQAIDGAGIILKQYESVTDSADGEYMNGKGYLPYQGTITAICATANGSLAIMER